MFGKLFSAIAVAFLAGCLSAPRASDMADAASTAAVIASGGTELNPIVGGLGDSAAPFVAVPLKMVARTVADQIEDEGQREAVHTGMDTLNAGLTCNNLGVVFGAANPPLVGVACALGYATIAGVP
jgi:hypothetical protein